MTKISNQYSLTNILTADLANSRLGINNVSPTVALDVTGAGKFSGTVTTGGATAIADALLPIQINAVATTGQAYFASNNNGSYGLLMGYDNANGYARIRNVSNTALTFETNNTEKVRITAAGNVGIGTTSPTNLLHIVSSAGTQSAIQIAQTARGTGVIGMQAAASVPANMVIGTDVTGNIIFKQGITTSDLSTGTERMRITTAGNVGIGNTSPSARLAVSGSGTDSFAISLDAANSTANGMTIYLPGNRSSDTTYRAITLGDDSAVRFRVFGNGNVQNTNGSYGTISDISIKENITDATVKLSDILKLKVRNFNFIGETNKQIGFIAQELEQVFPKLIDIDGETKLKSVKTSILIPMLVKSIQELSAENTSLINRIEALENK